jgi:SGNH hydrolase-like domain, acetyltransferase AlgX
MQGEQRAETQVGKSSTGESQDAFSDGLPTNRQVAAKASISPGRPMSAVFLALVVVCLVVPLLESLHPFLGTIVAPVDEHRTANRFPSPSLLLRASGDFADGLNKWFDDRVGFRDVLIRTKNQIDYSVFSTSRKVYVGSDGWLFERDPGLPLERLDANGFDALKTSFLELARKLGEKGIRLLVIGYPDKSRIYPEMVPADAQTLLPGGNYDKLRRFLALETTLTFIDVEEVLRREKLATTDRLYFKTDLHATERGQVAVIKEIIARIARAEGRPDIRWNENFERINVVWGPGNEARFLAPLVPVLENYSAFKGTYKPGDGESDGHWTIPEPQAYQRTDDGIGPLFAWEFHSLPGLCRERLPGTVLLGVSFVDLYPALGLHRYFCSFRRLDPLNSRAAVNRLTLFLDSVPDDTKYFIYQYYAPLIHFAPYHDFGARAH